ncbi:MAG: YceI family protein [Cytophagales bacterium]|nr:MAG: YceI family protein [Cytophagales bacterium]
MNHYKKQCLIIVSFFLLFSFIDISSVFSQKQWKVQNSSISFKIKNAGLTVDGKFGTAQASIVFDAVNFEQSSISASIEAKTIDTGIDSRDTHLRKADYFDATKYPQISMKSKKITKLANGTYEGFFDLMLKGVTKEVKIPFSYTENNNTATFEGSFTINRLDYGIGKSSWIMADNVTLKITINVN